MVAGAVAATPRKVAADGRGCLAISSRWLESGIPIFVIAGWGPNWELVERLSRSPDHFNRWQ
jgi:thiamine monophosphate synthase